MKNLQLTMYLRLKVWKLAKIKNKARKSAPATSIYFFKVIIYFWLHWVFVTVCGLSLVMVSRGNSSLQCMGFSLRWLLLLQSTGSRHAGFSSCGLRVLEHRLSSCGGTGLVALRHVGSSQTRARTHVPCLGRRILNHCTTRESHHLYLTLYWKC